MNDFPMKLTELADLASNYLRLPGYVREDPQVVIETKNGGVPTHHLEPVVGVNMGFDWTRGKFILRTENPLVVFQREALDIRGLAASRLAFIKEAWAKLRNPYIAKAHERAWLDGFREGMRMFRYSVDAVAEPQPEDRHKTL